ncbi:S8 family serine peptidase [Streptomyces sp. DSM 15324]|uniref:S8 family serine peptidase n=1 Tax=Streptomyces sp. DSM 15324 TaxID=1739111 RepID=UPI000748D338|nr:S8 family serine peptidase [Streptomyces sp. DSM 15324]KUO11455.1 peptidase [Streptomyces sp. DSM 15324]
MIRRSPAPGPRPRHALRALVVLLPVLAAVACPPAAGAVSGEPVRLPVMPSRLAAGAACTGGSATVAEATPWEQRDLELSRVRGVATGAGVTVAVVDTGVSAKAPSLAGRVTVVGAAGSDCVGHGTFVAGLIAAAPVRGVAFAGAAPRAHVLAVRGTDERGTATDATVAAGIRAAVDAGARVIAVSPAVSRSSAALRGAVAHAADHDALIVAAAAPDALRDRTSSASSRPPADYWPAADTGVLSVVDVDVRGHRPQGAVVPVHADLAAPGDGVLGIGPRGRGHFIGSGPSLAAAYVAATAALVRSAHPGLSAAGTARRLITSAYPADVPRLDPFGAVTQVPGAESVQAAPGGGSRPVRLEPDGSGARATRRALVVAGTGGGLLLAVAWAAAAGPRGRARRWRPAGNDPAPPV